MRRWAIAALGAMIACSAGNEPDAAPADAGVDAPSRVAVGQVLVRERACDSCHQSTNPADGILSGQTEPRKGTQSYPANLTPDIETGIGTWTKDQIVFAMRHGVDADLVVESVSSPARPPIKFCDVP